MDPGANAGVVAVPMLLMGLGLGALASQLGAVTVSAVPDARSAEVGGLQNTATNLGASLGTALIGSMLIATLSASIVAGIQNDPRVPASVQEQATTDLASGVPFLSDTQLRTALGDAHVSRDIPELGVAIGMLAALPRLHVPLQAVAEVVQQVGHRHVTDVVSEGRQGDSERPSTQTRPPQRRVRIAGRRRLDQRLQVVEKRRPMRGRPLPAAARSPRARRLERCTVRQVAQAASDGRLGNPGRPGDDADATAAQGLRFGGGPDPSRSLGEHRGHGGMLGAERRD